MPCHNHHWGVTYGSPSQHTHTPRPELSAWPGDAIRVIRGNQSDVKNVDPSSILTLSRLISEEWASRTRGRVSASVCGVMSVIVERVESEECYQTIIRDPETARPGQARPASITIGRAISAQQESAPSAH